MDDRQQREVARGLRAGSKAAWHALYDAYAEPIWRSVARQMGPFSTEVGDVVQEIFLAAARSARGFDASKGSLWMWLSGIARRQVALHFRKQQRMEPAVSAEGRQDATRGQVVDWLESRSPSPPDALAAAELKMMVRQTLSALPADYETLLAAKYFDGASVDEIAGAENSTATAIRSKLARARRAFRVAFAQISNHCTGASPKETG